MDFVNEVIERLLVTLDQTDKSLDSLVGIFLTNCVVVISALPMMSGNDHLRSSTCSTVFIKSFMKFCKSPRESAMLAARYTWANGE